MQSDSITVQILIEIRDELKATNVRIDGLAAEVAQTRQDLGRRIDASNGSLGRRIDTTNRQLLTTETRLVTEISALRSVLTETGPERRELRDRIEQCERDIAELRQRD